MSDSHLLNKTVIQNVSEDLSNTNLDNLTSTGESHFQAPLVSGDNIKTINSNSLLGSGDLVITSVPVGTVLVFAGSTAPTWYLLCDGSAVSRTTYSALFSVIGTTYGVGDSSSTFNLPNFQDRVIQGAGTRGAVGTYKAESLPNTTGSFSSTFIPTAEGSVTGYGVFSSSVRSSYSYHGFNNWAGAQVSIMFDSSKSSPTYQNGAPVQQNALLIQCFIKY